MCSLFCYLLTACRIRPPVLSCFLFVLNDFFSRIENLSIHFYIPHSNSQADLLTDCLLWNFGSQETRYRQRYLDLMVNSEVRHILKTRANIISYVRKFLDDLDFLEVLSFCILC